MNSRQMMWGLPRASRGSGKLVQLERALEAFLRKDGKNYQDKEYRAVAGFNGFVEHPQVDCCMLNHDGSP